MKSIGDFSNEEIEMMIRDVVMAEMEPITDQLYQVILNQNPSQTGKLCCLGALANVAGIIIAQLEAELTVDERVRYNHGKYLFRWLRALYTDALTCARSQLDTDR